MAGGVFNMLKTADYNVEYVQEFAKTLTWEKNHVALSNQFYVSGVQNYTQNMLLGQVQAVITDSPTLLGLLYYKEQNSKINNLFYRFMVESFKAQNNMNFFLNRKKKYNPSGRNQTEEESNIIADNMLSLLRVNDIPFDVVDGDDAGKKIIYDKVTERLK